jgi:hypothetical protein
MSLSFANTHFVVVPENLRLLGPENDDPEDEDDDDDDDILLVAQRPNALFFPLLVLKLLLPRTSHPLKEDATEEAIV